MESNERRQREIDVLGDKIRVLITGIETNGSYEILEFTSQQLCGPPPHSHPWSEASFILEGELEVTCEGQTSRVSAGGFVSVRAGQIHTYRVVSPHARFLVFATPSGVYPFLEELARETQGLPEDPAKILDVSSKHSVSVVC